ncbi:DUF4124 domain-containing protein [uncultured Ralstonia sp.]|jgi:hypothetical protein|uniref:DUF4124 domain-containing protein n=1 Tax=uncultured Ralstonia sp. TaxID=114715 RepID=UPI0025D1A8D9|nr:DUF4124 domain-containing protein [uncultured Ralstonia sp.]
MGVEDRNWYHDRKKQKPINPDWQREYNRWYGKPNTPTPKKPGMHWTLTLACWATFFLAVYIGVRYIMSFKVPAPSAPIQPAPPIVENTPQRPAQPVRQPQPEIVLYKCEDHGQTTYSKTPCPEPVRIITTQPEPPAQTQPPSQHVDPNAELARQWDARMAQRDRDIAAEQSALQAQTNATNTQCNQLRSNLLSIQRMPLTYQQTSPWREQMNGIRSQMNQLHC